MCVKSLHLWQLALQHRKRTHTHLTLRKLHHMLHHLLFHAHLLIKNLQPREGSCQKSHSLQGELPTREAGCSFSSRAGVSGFTRLTAGFTHLIPVETSCCGRVVLATPISLWEEIRLREAWRLIRGDVARFDAITHGFPTLLNTRISFWWDERGGDWLGSEKAVLEIDKI